MSSQGLVGKLGKVSKMSAGLLGLLGLTNELDGQNFTLGLSVKDSLGTIVNDGQFREGQTYFVDINIKNVYSGNIDFSRVNATLNAQFTGSASTISSGFITNTTPNGKPSSNDLYGQVGVVTVASLPTDFVYTSNSSNNTYYFDRNVTGGVYPTLVPDQTANLASIFFTIQPGSAGQSVSFSFLTGAGDVSFNRGATGTPYTFSGSDLGGLSNNIQFINGSNNVGISLVTSSVPEPSTYAAIVGLAALGAAALRGRRKIIEEKNGNIYSVTGKYSPESGREILEVAQIGNIKK